MALRAQASDEQEISALSRPLYLGMLYNARKDQPRPGISLWSTKDMIRNTKVDVKPDTRFKVAASRSLSDKTSLLDVSASVKASFFSGLVTVGGSAKYLEKNTSSSHQCSFTLKYHVTTEFKQLMISELGTPNPEVFGRTDATHVVSGVLYGADALMEFRAMASDDSSRKEIEGNLNVMLNKIPSLKFNADGSLKINDKDQKKVENFKCKFSGDFQLKELPSKFEQAVKVFNELPGLLGEKGENAVPVRVWLYPLSKLTNTESKLKRMISETLVSQIEKMMDDFHQAEITTNDLLKRSKKIEAEDISNKLKNFQSSLNVFTTVFQQRMANLIPAIRGGDMEETTLRDLLKTNEASGFSEKEMKQWLDGKHSEIEIVTDTISNLNKITNHKIICPGDFYIFLMNSHSRHQAVFNFTSLRDEEPYLEKLSKAVELAEGTDLSKILNDSLSLLKNPGEEVPWYKRSDAWDDMKVAIKVFGEIDLEANHKVISFIPHPGLKGASVYGFCDGKQTRTCMTNRLQLFSFRITLDQNTAHLNLSLPNVNTGVTFTTGQQSWDPDYSTRFDRLWQVLSKDPLIGRCYWMCSWIGFCSMGVAHKSMERKGNGNASTLGRNNKSWCLEQRNGSYSAWHNNTQVKRNIPVSNTEEVVVYLDRDAGKLSFYSLDFGTLRHMYTFDTHFTDEPLYAGFRLGERKSAVYTSL